MKTNSTLTRLIAAMLAIMSLLGAFAINVSAAKEPAAAKLSEIPTEGFLWPANKKQVISSPFNLDSKTLQNQRKKSVPDSPVHSGVDIGGTFDVLASRSGKVVYVQNKGSNMGNCCYVEIEHEVSGKVFYTRYLHFKSGSITVKKGQTVTAGQVLGTSGNTGYSYGSHLHFEVSTVRGGSTDIAKKMNVNPKTSFGVKYNSTYSTKANKAEIDKHAVIDYSFNADEVKQLNEWQKGTNRCFTPKYYYVAKDGTTRTYPAEAASKVEKLKKNDIVYVTEEGFNAYGNRWFKVRSLNSDKYSYIYESYIGKEVTSSTLAKPAFCLFSPKSAGNKTVEIKLKSAAAKGCIYVAKFTYKSGGKTVSKTAEFSGSSLNYRIGTTGNCTIVVYTKVNDSAMEVKSASTSAVTVNVKN